MVNFGVGSLGREVGPNFVGYVASRLDRRLEGLTDDEYRWEPVGGCWSIRPDADGVWRADLGPGGSMATPTSPPPFTTLAWRLWHLGASPNPTWPPPRPASAAELVDQWWAPRRSHSSANALPDAQTARRLVAEHWAGFADAVGEFSDDDLLHAMGPVAGPFAEGTVLGLVLHIGDELVHHAAEVGVLRDLYAHR